MSYPDYRYRPLRRPDSIRLLSIQPSKWRTSALRCNLSTYRLSDTALKFEALSYTWGHPKNRTTIRIGSGQNNRLRITRNCFNALVNIRHRTNERRIWVDAICINQNDLSEQTAQVKIMVDIYKSAYRVLVYLGEPTPGSRRLFQELAEAESLPKQNQSRSSLMFVDRPSISDGLKKDLKETLSRPWFQRIWTLQEHALSQDCLIICGPDITTWQVFKSCLFGYNGHLVLPSAPYVIYTNWATSIESPHRALWYLLSETRNYQASNPKDYIFALFGLLHPTADLIDLIDYDQSDQNLHINLCRSLLDEIGLVLLLFTRIPHNLEMPSWCPNFSQRSPLPSSRIHGYVYQEMWTTPNIYNDEVASKDESNYREKVRENEYDGGSIAEYYIDTEHYNNVLFSKWHQLQCFEIVHESSPDIYPLRLHVVGRLVSQIQEVGSAFHFKNEKRVSGQWSSLCKYWHLCKAMSANVDFIEIVPEAPLCLRSQIPPTIRKNLLKLDDIGADHLFSSKGKISRLVIDDEESVEGFRIACEGQSLFITTDGIVGRAPKEIQKGDFIALLRGGHSIFALRQFPPHGWKIIGGDVSVGWVPQVEVILNKARFVNPVKMALI